MPRTNPRLTPNASNFEVRAWLLLVDPELAAAADEVDSSLTEDTLRLSCTERLDRGVATQRWLTEARRAWTAPTPPTPPPAKARP